MISAKTLGNSNSELSRNLLLLVILESVLTWTTSTTQNLQQTVQLIPFRLVTRRILNDQFTIFVQILQKSNITDDMSEKIRKIDVPRPRPRNVVSRILLHLKLMKTQGKRIHEDQLQQLHSHPHHSTHTLTVVEVIKKNLTIFNSEVQKISQITVPKHIDTPPILIVSLSSRMDSNIVEHGHQNLQQSTIILQISEIKTVSRLNELQTSLGSGVKILNEGVRRQKHINHLLQERKIRVVLKQGLQTNRNQIHHTLMNV